MELDDAIKLIANDKIASLRKQEWADFGCGTGTFTQGLARLLQSQSVIHAVDIEQSTLKQIPAEYNDVIIKKVDGNFGTDQFPFTNLDGILMANSLHYIKDKVACVRRAARYLKKGGGFLLVEYDTSRANPWVPYPLPYSLVSTVFSKAGFFSVTKLGEMPSRFGHSKLFSVFIEK